MVAELAAVFAAAALVALIGARLLSRHYGALTSSLGRPATLALAWLLGLALLAPLALALGLLGIPLRPWSLVPLALGAAGVAWLIARRSSGEAAVPQFTAPEQPALLWAARAVLAAAILLALLRVAVMPLWSWDHHAIWGVKARRLAAEGGVSLTFLNTPEFKDARPDYPLGFPTAALVHAWGRPPSPLAFKAFHLLASLALLALLAAALRVSGAGRAAALVLTAWVAAMPLFWDTEAVGQAEMPLALVSVAALTLLLLTRTQPALAPLAGLALGFLPWIKHEGWPLAVALGAWGLWSAAGGARRTLLQHLAAGALPLVALERLVAFLFLPPGVGFFSGDPLARLGERLPQAGSILAAMLRHLAAPEALGLWLLLPFVLVALALRRDHLALGLALVVGFQLALYMVISFGVYLPPLDHIRASFPRITAALAPLAVVLVGRASPGRMEP